MIYGSINIYVQYHLMHDNNYIHNCKIYFVQLLLSHFTIFKIFLYLINYLFHKLKILHYKSRLGLVLLNIGRIWYGVIIYPSFKKLGLLEIFTQKIPMEYISAPCVTFCHNSQKKKIKYLLLNYKIVVVVSGTSCRCI